MHQRRKWSNHLFVLVALLVMAGAGAAFFYRLFPGGDDDTGPAGAAWVTEWDMAAGWNERRQIAAALASTQLFQAVFDEDGQVYIPDKLVLWIASHLYPPPPGAGKVFLTAVNDVVRNGGANSLKDPDLVSRILATPETRAAHRRDLVDLARSGPFAGLDLDYERVKAEDWPAYLEFCRVLAQDLGNEGLELRVVLEPKRQYYRHPLPPGPEYVVMAYNLHGDHSGPGPKADMPFIERLAESCREAGADARLALATGGFVWREKGPTSGVTETGALALAKAGAANPVRDPESRYLHFAFDDKDTGKNEVWYADGETLVYLIDVARENGFRKFDLWRLGGNAPESLDKVCAALAPKGGMEAAAAAAGPEVAGAVGVRTGARAGL